MGLFKEARKFVIKQRIKELKNAVKHWPNSQYAEDRKCKIFTLRLELEAIDKEE